MFYHKDLIAIDFGSSCLKILSLQKKGKKYVLVKKPIVETIPRGIIHQGSIEKADELRAILKTVAKKHNIFSKFKKLSIAIGGNASIVRRINVDLIKGAGEEEEQIRQSAEQVLTNFNTLYWSYSILDNEGYESSLSVLLCAVKVEVIENYISVIKGSIGSKVGVIDTSISSLSNCYRYNYGKNQGINAILEIGATYSSIVFFYNGVYCYSKVIGMGGDYYTDSLSSDLGVDKDRAENLKISLNQGKSVPSEVGGIINNNHDILAGEVNQTLDFFAKSSILNIDNKTINVLYMCGGGALIPGIAPVIAKSCNVKVEFLDPFMRIGSSISKSLMKTAKNQGNFYSVGLGLGIRRVGDDAA